MKKINNKIKLYLGLGDIGDWGLGIGDWGYGMWDGGQWPSRDAQFPIAKHPKQPQHQ